MKRIVSKIARFFWSWGFLKFILWTITLVILFYVEEDWRGARAWAATKAKWEAKGESFDPNKFIPPPVSDDQNLAAIPAFKLVPVKNDDGKIYLLDGPLNAALKNLGPAGFPKRTFWHKGELFDKEELRKSITDAYTNILKQAPERDSIAQLDALFPFVADLRAASARPYCRFDYDETAEMPAGRELGLVAGQVPVGRILEIYALCELENHRPDVALDYIKLIFRLADGAQRDSSVVGALVKMAMFASASNVIYDGLAHHLWSDAQLVEIEHLLGTANFLADYQWAMRDTAVDAYLNMDALKKMPPSFAIRLLTGMGDSPPPIPHQLPHVPSGWWDLAKSMESNGIFSYLDPVDPVARRIYPERADQLQRDYDQRRKSGSYLPWEILCDIMLGPLINIVTTTAQGQVYADETQIACALERYRLAHKTYPGSLDELVPDCIGELPHDIMTGEPYHYRLQPDGSFLLYSVGGNQKDDGGNVIYEKKNPNRMEFEQGDWTWPTPQPAPKSTP